MNRLSISLASFVLLLSTSAAAVTVDLVDGDGALIWDTSVSVTSPSANTSVTHPLFPANRHTHEGWFIYIEDFSLLVEFAGFTKTVDGVDQDTISSTLNAFGETFVLDLTYGIDAVGPDGLPDLTWSGGISRQSPGSPFQIMNVRLFNVFDYDIGVPATDDTGTASQIAGPATLMEFEGDGGVTGFRGAYMTAHYTVDTLGNVLAQIQGPHTLNDTAAAGAYDVAGAFEWVFPLCYDNTAPECQGTGSGSGALGGFGGFGSVPEPSAAVLLLAGLLAVTRRR